MAQACTSQNIRCEMLPFFVDVLGSLETCPKGARGLPGILQQLWHIWLRLVIHTILVFFKHLNPIDNTRCSKGRGRGYEATQMLLRAVRTQCACSAKFWMSANTPTLVSPPFHKFLVPY